jgi:hypothetical protein
MHENGKGGPVDLISASHHYYKAIQRFRSYTDSSQHIVTNLKKLTTENNCDTAKKYIEQLATSSQHIVTNLKKLATEKNCDSAKKYLEQLATERVSVFPDSKIDKMLAEANKGDSAYESKLAALYRIALY